MLFNPLLLLLLGENIAFGRTAKEVRGDQAKVSIYVHDSRCFRDHSVFHQHVTSLDYSIHEFGHGFSLINNVSYSMIQYVISPSIFLLCKGKCYDVLAQFSICSFSRHLKG